MGERRQVRGLRPLPERGAHGPARDAAGHDRAAAGGGHSKEKCKNEETILKAHVERGMGTGAELSFPRMSEQRPGQIPGNVVMTLKQKAHPRFKRSGDDLHADMVLTLKEALLGF